jgi:zinc transport system substrate-binding protein
MRMRIVIFCALAGLLALAVGILASGNGGGKSGDASDDRGGGTKSVVAGFYPLAYAAQQVGDGTVRVTNLTPPGAEPHDLELSPDAVSELKSADLVLLLGQGFQPQLERAAGRGDRVLDLLDTPGLERFPGDPHVWLDPFRYARIVQRVGDALGERQAAERLIARLGRLDREFQRGLAACRRQEIVTSHEAFAYLADRYGLRQIAITGVSPESEPAPRDLQRVVDQVQKTGATTVYFETLVSPKLARTVARETGARTAVLDPIEGLTREAEDRGADYFSVMRANLAVLRKGLGCR